MGEQESKSDEMSQKAMWVVTAVAVIAAAAPHAFFPPPLELHMAGDMQGWLGISVWAPAILAGVAFFFNVEFGARRKLKKPPIETAVVCAVALFVFQLATLAQALELRWTEMSGMRPWGELQVALPMYFALGAMLPLFWQGFVQHRVMSKMSAGLRTLAVVALSTVVYLPFIWTGQDLNNEPFLMVLAFENLAAAAIYEIGIPVWGVMIYRGLCGLAFIWFQQAMLL